MPVLEARPELAVQQQEVAVNAGDQPAGAPLEGPPHPETPADMTSEQAIKACPYLGQLALQNPDLAKQKAQEYLSDPDKMAELHLGEEDRELEPEEEDSFWDNLEAEFVADKEVPDRGDETAGDGVKEKKSELFEDLRKESSTAMEPEPTPLPESASIPLPELELSATPEPEPAPAPDPELMTVPTPLPEPERERDLYLESATAITQFDRESAIAQEEALSRQLSYRNSRDSHKRAGAKEQFRHVVDTDGVVRRVIAANQQASQAFRNGDDGALDILVGEAKKLSKAA